jgi:hypothetical protein
MRNTLPIKLNFNKNVGNFNKKLPISKTIWVSVTHQIKF